MNTDQKVAIITGGSSGIGQASCRLLAEKGYKTAIIDLNEPRKDPGVHDTIQKEGSVFLKADVTRPEEMKQAIESVFNKFGRIDVLINCAGIDKQGSVENLEVEDWLKVVDVDLNGTFISNKYVIPFMKSRGEGAIVNVSSALGVLPSPEHSAYCAAKAGVISLTRVEALEYMKSNIRVNCVAPGPADTPLFMGTNPDLNLATSNRIGNRLATPDEIAKGIYFLVSEEASYITGTTLVIDGGGIAGSKRMRTYSTP